MLHCAMVLKEPLPITEDKAIAYVVTLAGEGIQAATVKYHLAGLRQAQIKAGSASAKLGSNGQAEPDQDRHCQTQGCARLHTDGKESGDSETHVCIAGSLEQCGEQRDHATGSDVPVLLWVPESR